MGVDEAVIAAALATYPGLPHRQELVGRIDGIDYVNDSKATNAEAASRALACYRNIYWIAGGLAKQGGLGPALEHAANIRHGFLVGNAAPEFAAALAGQVPVTDCGTLADALGRAHRLAQSERLDGAVVLLSPACASFDQWKSFEARGDAFRAMVLDLLAGDAPREDAP
jgi:UDP-N-acetylmuramoylalanine--D-glutamate ligase